MITQFLVLSRFGLVLWRQKSKFNSSEEIQEIDSSINRFVTDVLLEERDAEKRRYVVGEVRSNFISYLSLRNFAKNLKKIIKYSMK